jgi:GrpB-like predicted nucleotidyltransferase (UPF0157 family)
MHTEPIIIVPYDPDWPVQFREIADAIRQAIGSVAVRIDHIGSTSVPGLAAKPVIDIQIAVRDFEPFAAIREPLEQLGYVWRSDNPELTKRYFREAPGTPRTHIHVRRRGSFHEQFALLFRDYLRATPQRAADYAALKYALATQFTHDRDGYQDAKAPFIWQIIQEADLWAKATGWHA